MSAFATVLSPYSWGSAVELANRQWKKRVLPVGDVEYQGRTLHFTPSYLKTLEEAFRDRAYDYVPLQLADAKNAHTNAPERFRGTITDMRAEQDGLWITLSPTDDGERVLKENPYLGVSCRIVEQYDRSDGKHYEAAVQHVLATHDPRIPGLGQWQPLDMANSGGMIIDLSASTWAGEPGPPDPGDELTDQELAELLDAMGEANAEESAAYSELEHFDATFSANWAAEQAREQARQAADLDDLTRPARTDEQIMARAISRAQNGIYDTSHAALGFANEEAAIELTMTTGEGLCGTPDPFGRCSSRFHDLRCVHAISTDWSASEPPSSTYSMALSNFASSHAIGPAPASYGDPGDPDSTGHAIPQRTLEFAHALNESWGMHADTGHRSPAPDWNDLLGPSYGGDPYAALAIEAGRPDLAGPQPQLPGGYPDVSALRAGLGI